MKGIRVSCIILSVLALLGIGIIAGLSSAQTMTSCPKDMTVCENGTHCTDLMTDEENCGSCGNVCPQGLSCFNGTCGCLEGETLCDGRCISTSVDTFNCGKCGNACPEGQYCSSGTCACVTGNILCNGTCIDMNYDDNNCGKCGNVCQSGSFCLNGECARYR